MNITSDELIQNFFKTGSTVSLPRIDSESQVSTAACVHGIQSGASPLSPGAGRRAPSGHDTRGAVRQPPAPSL